MKRPEPDRNYMVEEVPDGYAVEWEPAGDNWRFSDKDRECRRPGCPNTAVVRLNRSRDDTPRWWHYCADHLYGRRVENGVILGPRWVKVKP